MMFSEDDLLPVSALQHVVFCERQAALIHVEQQWEDNSLTVEGDYLHAVVESGKFEARGPVRVARSLPIRSLVLGLSGKTDVVEFIKEDEGTGLRTGRFEGVRGLWRPFPVEYKRGKPKSNSCDKVQLCAQAMCLEEMLGADVPAGALFYGQTKRRLPVEFTASLRSETLAAILRFRKIIETRKTPAPDFGPKCGKCSLVEICQPEAFGHSARDYVRRMIRQALS